MPGSTSNRFTPARLTAPGESFELIDVAIDGRPQKAFHNAQTTLEEMIGACATDLPFWSIEMNVGPSPFHMNFGLICA